MLEMSSGPDAEVTLISSVGNLPNVIGDGDRLSQVFNNLVDNALKFSLEDSDVVKVSLRHDDDEVLLSVEDNGPGIPEEEAERVLEPFVKLDPARGHRTGYGLGLNLCQRIVQAHKGTIHIGPAEVLGTIVEVRLPV